MMFGIRQLFRTNQPSPENQAMFLADRIIENDEGTWLDIKKQRILTRISGNDTNIYDFGRSLLSAFADVFEISQAAIFINEKRKNKEILTFKLGYAFSDPEDGSVEFESGEGLIGQVAADGKAMLFNSVPQGFFTIQSGLGKSNPVSLYIFPLKNGNRVLGVIEIASFRKITEEDVRLINHLEPMLSETVESFTNN